MPLITADRVKQTTTTTGTGPFALTAVESGYLAFSTKCAVGDTFLGSIVADNGDWQSGLFRYSAANQVTTVEVHDSSNAGSAVSFSAGNKEVFIGLTARFGGSIREKLTAVRTYYVRTDGSDSNTGLSDTSAGAFLTIQKAIDTIADTLDTGLFEVKVKVGDGTRTSPVVMRPYIGAGTVVLEGNVTTPANCVISTTSASCVSNSSGRFAEVKGFKLQTTTSGYGLTVSGGGSVVSFSAIDFGSTASSHLQVSYGGRITASGNYTISGGALSHAEIVEGGALATANRTVTLVGTPAFTVAYVYMRNNSMAVMNAMTFSGSATGSRFSINLNSSCFTNGSSEASYLPGNSAGSKTTGGEYA